MKWNLKILVSVFFFLSATSQARADIYQWEWVNPSDPTQGVVQSSVVCSGGSGVSAMPGADLASLDLTQAYLIGENLTNAAMLFANLTNANLSFATLTGANLGGATLIGANLTGANVAGTYFYGSNLAAGQLYSTASYQAQNLQGIDLHNINLTGWNFSGQNLSGAWFWDNTTLTNTNLSGANLANADFGSATLTGANLTGANVAEANFEWSNLAAAQLYSTASYQAQNLQGINLGVIDLTGWNFAGQNLTNAYLVDANLTNANLTGADLRGPQHRGEPLGSAITTNTILPNGTIHGLTLDSTNPTLLVRNYSGSSSIPIHVLQGMSMSPAASLVLEFDGDPWGSTISLASGIPVLLGGDLELDLVAGVDPASLVGDSFQVFGWAGVSPSGQFANISNNLPAGYSWDTSQLYTSGEVTLVPESGTLALLCAGAIGLVGNGWRRRAARTAKPAAFDQTPQPSCGTPGSLISRLAAWPTRF